jgi:hypothetical protein
MYSAPWPTQLAPAQSVHDGKQRETRYRESHNVGLKMRVIVPLSPTQGEIQYFRDA